MDINMLLNPIDGPVAEYPPTTRFTPINPESSRAPTTPDQADRILVDQESKFHDEIAGSSSDETLTQRGMLTDEEILRGGLRYLHGSNFLQVAKTRRNKEIMTAVNSYQPKPVLTMTNTTNRLNVALTRVALDQARSRDSVKQELNEARAANGIPARRDKERSELSSAANRADRKRKLEESSLTEEFEIIDEAEQEEEGERLEALREECDELLEGDVSLLVNDVLLKVASMNTRAEIVEKVNSSHSNLNGSAISENAITGRLARAYKNVAGQNGKSSEAVKTELATARERNGVAKRKAMHAGAMHRASHAAKKVKVEVKHEDKIDNEENPLGDIEEMSRRHEAGLLNDDSEEDDFFEPRAPPRSKRVLPWLQPPLKRQLP